jgi:hypothetical protein
MGAQPDALHQPEPSAAQEHVAAAQGGGEEPVEVERLDGQGLDRALAGEHPRQTNRREGGRRGSAAVHYFRATW